MASDALASDHSPTPQFQLFGATPFLYRLPALLITGLFLGVAWFGAGTELNVPALFFHDSPRLQIANGFFAACLIVYVWLVTLIVDLRFGFDPAAPSHASWLAQLVATLAATAAAALLNGPFDGMLRWLTVPLIYLLVARGLFIFSPVQSRLDRTLNQFIRHLEWTVPGLTRLLPQWPQLRTGLARTAMPFVIFLFLAPALRPLERSPMSLGVLLACLFLYAMGRLIQRVAGTTSDPPKVVSTEDAEVSLKVFAQVIFALLVLVFGASAIWNHHRFPPVLAVCLLLALIAGVNAAIWFHLRYWAPLGFGLLALALVLCNGQPYRVRFSGLETAYDQPTPIGDDAEPEVSLVGMRRADLGAEYERVLRMCARLHQRIQPRTLAEWEAQLTQRSPSYAELIQEYQDLLTRMDKEEEALLDQWRASTEKATGEARPKMVLVATSGGANRSSLWTAVVLKRLEDELPGNNAGLNGSYFPRHIRLITGASGGMVGAAHYVATLDPNGHPNGFVPQDIAADYLTPILNNTAFREAPLLFCPVSHYTDDRGQALETALERTTANLGKSFEWFDSGEREGWRPSLVFSPMVVEDGRRVIISNRMLPDLTSAEGSLLLGDRPLRLRTLRPSVKALKDYLESGDAAVIQSADPTIPSVKQPRQRLNPKAPDYDVYSRSAIELFRLLPDARKQFRVSTAARMNASFPYVSPAVDLPTDPPRRVVDAGYYDNYGVNLAARWILHHLPWLLKNTSGVALIQIRDTPSEYMRRQLHDPDEPLLYEPSGARRTKKFSAQVTYGWQWLTSPVSGASAARWSITSFRNDELLEQVSDSLNAFDTEEALPFFTTVVFERPSEIGMSWYLSPADKQLIVSAFGGAEDLTPNRSVLDRFRNWWRGQQGPRLPQEGLQFRP